MIDLTKERPVSIADAAALFGVHRRTVEGWFGVGLESVKVGGRIFTSREALQRFAVPTHRDQPADDETASAQRELAARFGV